MADGEDTGPLNIEGQAAGGDIHAIRLVLDAQIPKIRERMQQLEDLKRKAMEVVTELRSTGATDSEVNKQLAHYKNLANSVDDLGKKVYNLQKIAERGLAT